MCWLYERVRTKDGWVDRPTDLPTARKGRQSDRCWIDGQVDI